MEIRFEEIVSGDLNRILHLQPEGWPDIVPEFEFYIRKGFCHPVKALFKENIVGVGASIRFNRTAWLAHIIVDRFHRSKGIGLQITNKLLKEQVNRSVDTFLLIATESGRPVYEKVGFTIVTDYLFLKRNLPWKDFSISPHILAYNNNYYSALMELDWQISGEERKPLLEEFLYNALVYVENDAVEGFYMPDLGEGLILAATENAGRELMKVKYSKTDKAVLPAENIPGNDFLQQNGFSITDTRGTRMILGQDINWKPGNVFSRIGGNFG